jgi:predicted  nucleic acid-binding Zn-ribbon protein
MLHSNGKSTSLASHYEIDQLKSEILEKNKEVQNLLSSNERFSREIDNLNNQLLSVKTNKLDFIDDKTEEIHRLVKFNKHLEKENEKLNKQLIAVNEEKENVMKELAADGRQLSEMQKKFELLMKSFENLQTNSVTKDQVNKINASMKSTNESLKNEIEQLRNSETKLKQTIYIVVEKFRRLKRSMIDLSKDIHSELSNESLAIYNKLETLLRVVNEPNISSSNVRSYN